MDIGLGFGFFTIILAFIGIILFAMLFRFFSLWFQAFVSGTPIPLTNIIGMSLRKIPPHIIVSARINSFKAGLKMITVADLETHYLAGGHVLEVVRAMIAADKANISLDWRQATAIDLAGRDLRQAIETSVNPKVIDCPSHGGFMTGVAKDGIQVLVRARVTVRTNLQQLVGGATEETIIARVGEGIVSAIGAAENYQTVLESPHDISRRVLDKGLDSSTAFVILSLDIVEIQIGENVGAILRLAKAKADMGIFQAEAEKRRALAVATEQENIAKIKESESRLVEARAAVPLAMAEAFKMGNLGVMDYVRIQNIQADSDMRSSIAKPTDDISTHEG